MDSVFPLTTYVPAPLVDPVLLSALFIVVSGFYWWYTRSYGLWRSLGVPGPKPTFPFGSKFVPFITPVWEIEESLYKQANRKFIGYFEFRRPVLYVADPKLVRSITIQHFEAFRNRRSTVGSEIFSGMLTVLRDDKWKQTRAVISHTFSACKIKAMHPLCLSVAENLNNFVRERMREDRRVEFKDAFGRYTMDNIALCAFGLTNDSFNNPNTEFVTNAEMLFKPPSLYMVLRLFMWLVFPGIASRLSDPAEKMDGFFKKVIQDAIQVRENSDTTRTDFLQLLLDTKNKEGKRVLSDESILHQCLLFFLVGYETAATAMTFAAYSLATNPHYQNLLHNEIDSVLEKHNGNMTYEAIADMTYLDRFIWETLRLYPPVTGSEREVNAPFTLPETKITIPRGTLVQFAIYSIHRDAQYYSDPLRFDPDRFHTDTQKTRPPCTYLPFGSGPRHCVAMRFALFEIKTALANLMREFTLSASNQTPTPTLRLDRKSFLLNPINRELFLTVQYRR